MADLQILWTPVGENMPDLGTRPLVDFSDGDTPTLRMPVRMLSVDTPEVTAHSEEGAGRVDAKFVELANWIRQGLAPITQGLANHLLPRLETGHAGTLQFTQGKSASAWSQTNVETRLTRPDGSKRALFIRTVEPPFENNHRLLAYLAPNYTPTELATMTLTQRSTFNLDLIRSGWAAPFIIFPSIPGEADLSLFVQTAEEAVAAKLGIWANPLTLFAYEYRMCEKLHSITKRLVAGEKLDGAKRHAWRSRYVADMRTRALHGPESYMNVPPQYSIWIWPADVQRAISMLNLVPTLTQ